MTTTPIRLLIADDHALFRDGLRAIFMAVTDIEIVGEAESGDDAIQQAHELKPDVILMDIQMEPMSGIDATRHILADLPDTRVIMLTMLEDTDSLFAAMVAGARGYVLKGARRSDVLKTIRAAANGEVLFGPDIADRVTRFFRTMDQPADTPADGTIIFPELTEREHDILDHIARGLNNQAISTALGIAPKTVANHVSNILNKLQVTDRARAIIKAREAGMGRDRSST